MTIDAPHEIVPAPSWDASPPAPPDATTLVELIDAPPTPTPEVPTKNWTPMMIAVVLIVILAVTIFAWHKRTAKAPPEFPPGTSTQVIADSIVCQGQWNLNSGNLTVEGDAESGWVAACVQNLVGYDATSVPNSP